MEATVNRCGDAAPESEYLTLVQPHMPVIAERISAGLSVCYSTLRFMVRRDPLRIDLDLENVDISGRAREDLLRSIKATALCFYNTWLGLPNNTVQREGRT